MSRPKIAQSSLSTHLRAPLLGSNARQRLRTMAETLASNDKSSPKMATDINFTLSIPQKEAIDLTENNKILPQTIIRLLLDDRLVPSEEMANMLEVEDEDLSATLSFLTKTHLIVMVVSGAQIYYRINGRVHEDLALQEQLFTLFNGECATFEQFQHNQSDMRNEILTILGLPWQGDRESDLHMPQYEAMSSARNNRLFPQTVLRFLLHGHQLPCDNAAQILEVNEYRLTRVVEFLQETQLISKVRIDDQEYYQISDIVQGNVKLQNQLFVLFEREFASASDFKNYKGRVFNEVCYLLGISLPNIYAKNPATFVRTDLSVLGRVLHRSRGFNWRLYEDQLPQVREDIFVGNTNNNGGIMPHVIPGFVYDQSILGFKEAGWQVFLADISLNERGAAQLQFRCKKDGEKDIIRTFQVNSDATRVINGQKERLAEGREEEFLELLCVETGELANYYLSRLVTLYDEGKEINWELYDAILGCLEELPLGPLGTQGRYSFTPISRHIFRWGLAKKVPRGAKVQPVIKRAYRNRDGLPELQIELINNEGDLFTCVIRISSKKRTLLGDLRLETERTTYDVFDLVVVETIPGKINADRNGELRKRLEGRENDRACLFMREVLHRPQGFDWEQHAHRLPVVDEDLFIGTTNDRGYITPHLVTGMPFNQRVLPEGEGGWRVYLADISLNAGGAAQLRFKCTKDGQEDVIVTFQVVSDITRTVSGDPRTVGENQAETFLELVCIENGDLAKYYLGKLVAAYNGAHEVDWTEYNTMLRHLRDLPFSALTSDGVENFTPIELYNFPWTLSGFVLGEDGVVPVIKDAYLNERGWPEFQVVFTHEGETITRTFQIGPFPRALLGHKGTEAENARAYVFDIVCVDDGELALRGISELMKLRSLGKKIAWQDYAWYTEFLNGLSLGKSRAGGRRRFSPVDHYPCSVKFCAVPEAGWDMYISDVRVDDHGFFIEVTSSKPEEDAQSIELHIGHFTKPLQGRVGTDAENSTCDVFDILRVDNGELAKRGIIKLVNLYQHKDALVWESYQWYEDLLLDLPLGKSGVRGRTPLTPEKNYPCAVRLCAVPEAGLDMHISDIHIEEHGPFIEVTSSKPAGKSQSVLFHLGPYPRTLKGRKGTDERKVPYEIFDIINVSSGKFGWRVIGELMKLYEQRGAFYWREKKHIFMMLQGLPLGKSQKDGWSYFSAAKHFPCRARVCAVPEAGWTLTITDIWEDPARVGVPTAIEITSSKGDSVQSIPFQVGPFTRKVTGTGARDGESKTFFNLLPVPVVRNMQLGEELRNRGHASQYAGEEWEQVSVNEQAQDPSLVVEWNEFTRTVEQIIEDLPTERERRLAYSIADHGETDVNAAENEAIESGQPCSPEEATRVRRKLMQGILEDPAYNDLATAQWGVHRALPGEQEAEEPEIVSLEGMALEKMGMDDEETMLASNTAQGEGQSAESIQPIIHNTPTLPSNPLQTTASESPTFLSNKTLASNVRVEQALQEQAVVFHIDGKEIPDKDLVQDLYDLGWVEEMCQGQVVDGETRYYLTLLAPKARTKKIVLFVAGMLNYMQYDNAATDAITNFIQRQITPDKIPVFLVYNEHQKRRISLDIEYLEERLDRKAYIMVTPSDTLVSKQANALLKKYPTANIHLYNDRYAGGSFVDFDAFVTIDDILNNQALIHALTDV